MTANNELTALVRSNDWLKNQHLERGNMYILIIILGFTLIGTGVALWTDEHVIEKHYTTKEYIFRDKDGIVIQTQFDGPFFEQYKIVKKEKRKQN